MPYTPPPHIDLHPLMAMENPLPDHEDLTAQITVQLAATRLAAVAFTTADYTDPTVTPDGLWARYRSMRAEAADLAALLNRALTLIPYEQRPVVVVSTDAVVSYLTVPRHATTCRALPTTT